MRPRSSRPAPLKLSVDTTVTTFGDASGDTSTTLLNSVMANSPLGRNSPTAVIFRNRFSSQMRRVLPAYLLLIFLILIFANVSYITAPVRAANKYKRELRYIPKPENHVEKFPLKVWQSWRRNALSLDERDIDVARTWLAKNPQHRYEVLTDENAYVYVDHHYGPLGLNRPDIVQLFRSINAPIIKADLLRYLIMYAEGGVYADIDAEALRPISRFIPNRYHEQDVDMVIGVEIDQPDFKDHPILGQKSQSFCQWVFMCKPRLPVMMRLIEEVQEWLHRLSRKQGVPISQLKLDFDDIITGTGPSAFTTAILEQMNMQNKGPGYYSPMRGNKVSWEDFHDLTDSKLISGFLVLNVEAFAAGQGHSDSGNHEARGALVKHHYHASEWDHKHKRKEHPVYGMVETCNWHMDCVREWDKHVREFEKLSKDEKRLLIAKHEEEERQREERERQEKEAEEARKNEEQGKEKGQSESQPEPNHEGEHGGDGQPSPVPAHSPPAHGGDQVPMPAQ